MRVCVWIAASVGLLWPSVALAEGTLTFFAQSEVIGEEVTVEDVARLEGADAALRERVRLIPLGRSPQPMGAVTLSRPVIELALRHAGVWEELRLIFPREVRVARPGQRVSGQAATAQAQEATQRYLTEAAPAGYEARVRGLSPLQELLLPKGAVTMKAVGREGASLQGAALLTISVQVEGQPVMTRQVSAQVELTGPVCRFARDIARGELVGEATWRSCARWRRPGRCPALRLWGCRRGRCCGAGASRIARGSRRRCWCVGVTA